MKLLTALCYVEVFFLTLFLLANSISVNHMIGNSMYPISHNDDYALFQTAWFDKENIANGTVIAFRVHCTACNDSDMIVCHRIVEVAQDRHGRFYITKGDHNNNIDVAFDVRPDNITGIFLFILWRSE